MDAFELGWALKLPFDLEVHVAVEAIEGVASQHLTLLVQGTHTLLFVLELGELVRIVA
jgi:hypothetical protein